jgi:predicted DsbA family dithiol-disulfide isomerase
MTIRGNVDMTIEMRIFSDYVWPFCYIGKGIVDTLKKEFDIRDEWLSFELHPETPPEGMPYAKRFPDADVEKMYENIRKRGDEFGIKFGPRLLLSNSRMSLEASEYARDMGQYELFHERMFYTYFTESKDIGNPEVIKESASICGLDTDELVKALKERRYAHRLEASRKEAEKIHLTGVPTFIINGKTKVVGAQQITVFKDLLGKIGGKKS